MDYQKKKKKKKKTKTKHNKVYIHRAPIGLGQAFDHVVPPIQRYQIPQFLSPYQQNQQLLESVKSLAEETKSLPNKIGSSVFDNISQYDGFTKGPRTVQFPAPNQDEISVMTEDKHINGTNFIKATPKTKADINMMPTIPEGVKSDINKAMSPTITIEDTYPEQRSISFESARETFETPQKNTRVTEVPIHSNRAFKDFAIGKNIEEDVEPGSLGDSFFELRNLKDRQEFFKRKDVKKNVVIDIYNALNGPSLPELKQNLKLTKPPRKEDLTFWILKNYGSG
jgi:hypothetical protein